MAVENKFKLNFIAASVLMGLSLSAVAAEAVQAETSTVTAKAKTLAEVVTEASKITDADGKKTGVAAKVDIASIAVKQRLPVTVYQSLQLSPVHRTLQQPDRSDQGYEQKYRERT